MIQPSGLGNTWNSFCWHVFWGGLQEGVEMKLSQNFLISSYLYGCILLVGCTGNIESFGETEIDGANHDDGGDKHRSETQEESSRETVPDSGQTEEGDGDLAMIAPPFVVTEDEIAEIVRLFTLALEATIKNIKDKD